LAIFAVSYIWQSVLFAKVLPKLMFQSYRNSPRHTIQRRPDDPQKPSDRDPRSLEVVVFSDFECSLCRSLVEKLDREFNPLFDNRLRIVFKHYPLCSECNPYVETRLNPHACKAARAAEAARTQGGNESFWVAHDLLFKKARSKTLSAVDYRKFAETLRLDSDRFVADMGSDETTRRIREDIELGKSLGVTTTPEIFVGGRRVPKAATVEPDFWRTLARAYKMSEGQKRGSQGKVEAPTKPTTQPNVSGR
jgi:protein-disulfide isomerase